MRVSNAVVEQFRVGPWRNNKELVTTVHVKARKDGSRAWAMRLTRPCSI